MKKPKISLTVKQGDKVTKIADDINNLSPEAREIAVGIVDTLAEAAGGPDIFQWANQADGAKQELTVDLFFFTKNYTAYALKSAESLDPYIKSLFLYSPINDILLGAGTGMMVREIHNQTNDDNVIDFVDLEAVPNAQAVIEQIAYGEDQIELFDENEHSLKNMKGIVAKFYLQRTKQSFYMVKQLQQSTVLEGPTAWAITKGEALMSSLITMKVPADNQVLITDDRIFAFNVKKLTAMFGFDAKRKAKLAGVIADIEKNFKLSFPDGLTLEAIAKNNVQLTDKLLRSNPAAVTQNGVIEQADRFQLALMTDDDGAIIIMDGRDAIMFANLINDDYVDSDMTGVHYLAVKKKEVFPTEDQQMNLGA
jgi:hypothetical protein